MSQDHDDDDDQMWPEVPFWQLIIDPIPGYQFAGGIDPDVYKALSKQVLGKAQYALLNGIGGLVVMTTDDFVELACGRYRGDQA